MKLYAEDGYTYELDGENILVNDWPVLPGERHPHNLRLWLIGNEFGPVVALWACNEQEAFDTMLDHNYEQFLVDEKDVEDDPDGDKYTYLGNASEPCNLDYSWIKHVRLEKDRDFELCMKFAVARAMCLDNLGE